MWANEEPFCWFLPSRQSLFPAPWQCLERLPSGAASTESFPHLCLMGTNESLHSVMGNEQPSSTSQWQFSPSACCCWQLQESTCNYKVMFILFFKKFIHVYVTFCVSLWYSNSNTECTLEYCPWLRWILFSLFTLIEKLISLFPVFSILLQDTGNPENPRKMQWCGAIMCLWLQTG